MVSPLAPRTHRDSILRDTDAIMFNYTQRISLLAEGVKAAVRETQGLWFEQRTIKFSTALDAHMLSFVFGELQVQTTDIEILLSISNIDAILEKSGA